jgi:hypothetical protein
MKKIAIILIIILTAALYSCNGADSVTTGADIPTVPVTAAESGGTETAGGNEEVTYGDEWQFAALDRQILAEDEHWSVTGSGFAYKDGCLGISGSGYFDIASLTPIGDEENYIFEFEYLAKSDSRVAAGLNLLGIDSLPGSGVPGIWLIFDDSSVSAFSANKIDIGKKEGFRRVSILVDQSSQTVKISADGELCAKVKYEGDGETTKLHVYDADGNDKYQVTLYAPLYAGGSIKLHSAKDCSVYIKNIAFKTF